MPNRPNEYRLLLFLLILLPTCRAERGEPATPSPPPPGSPVSLLLAEMETSLGPDAFVERCGDHFLIGSRADRETTDRCRTTIHRVVFHLGRDFLDTWPRTPIRIYLLPDRESYESWCRSFLGTPPPTPYGFYRTDLHLMVMNIATGRGTLAHEIAHPLLETDFPGIPAWFNEGLASLFESSRPRNDGTLEGTVNWRLPGLLRGIRTGKHVSLETVMSTGTREFYGKESSLHYAVARHLCLYLQEQGELKAYYRRYRDNLADDPHGIAALEKVLGLPLEEIEELWKRRVEELGER